MHFATSVFCPLSVHICVEYDISIPRTKRPADGVLWLSAPRLRLLPCCHPLRVLCLSWRLCVALTVCPVPACPALILSPSPSPPVPPVASSVPLSGFACPSDPLLSLRGSVAHPVARGECLCWWGRVEGFRIITSVYYLDTPG